ncbi:hypothetical membrane protein [Treponema paraluiscuniculi Cuniculi A]|nr:hypothetical protein [Treponema paraluiscuniculi]AEH40104.1 hypothetical membrane protein [Treponema paraluiscuniculi Cuniculi A]
MSKYTVKRASVLCIFGIGLFVPATGTFACGLLLVLGFWVLFFSSLLARFLSQFFMRTRSAPLFEVCLTLSAAIMYDNLIQGFFPLVRMMLCPYLFITALSRTLDLCLTAYDADAESLECAGVFGIMIAGISLVRELVAFGCVSLPAPSGFLRIISFPPSNVIRFAATGAGTLISCGIVLWIFRSAGNDHTPSLRSEW